MAKLNEGGEVSFVDLGDSALGLPDGIDQAKAELRRVLGNRYETGREEIDDPDLVDQ